MQSRFVGAIVIGAAFSVASCSVSHHASTGRTAGSQPSAPYAVPSTGPGEIAREVFPGPNGSQFGESERLPRPGINYMLSVACVSTSVQKPTVTYQVLDAGAGSRPASPYSRTVISGTVTCHGGTGTLIGLPSLPHHPIQVSLAWKGDSVAKAYAVVAP